MLFSEVAKTGYYFEHVGFGGRTISVYNKEENSNYTPLEESPEVARHDGTKVVFPIDLNESVYSRESFVPPNYDSDSNEICEDNWDHKTKQSGGF